MNDKNLDDRLRFGDGTLMNPGEASTTSKNKHLALARRQRALYQLVKTHVENPITQCTLGLSCPTYLLWTKIGE